MQKTADDTGFTSFYLDHQPWLTRWLARRMNSRIDAADLAQDTFVSVWTTTPSHSLERIVEPRAYLATIARRILINLRRRQSLEKAYVEALAHLPEAFAISPEERTVLLQTLQQIDDLLARLPGRVREAFLLSQLEGLTYADIAARFGSSERTIKRYMAEAMIHCLEHID